MTDHGMLFSGLMISAQRKGLKTQTRRILTPKHIKLWSETARRFVRPTDELLEAAMTEVTLPVPTAGSAIPVECRASVSGSTVSIEIEGTVDQIDAAISEIEGRYPSPAYGTWFNWPPGLLFTSGEKKGQPNTHLAPSDIGGGRWIARGNRSRSSD